MKPSHQKFGAGVLLILLAAQLSGCSASAGLAPSKVTCNGFLQKMKAGQASAAYSLLSSPCKAVTTPQQMQNYWDLVEKNRGKVQSWTQQGFNVYSGTGGSSVQLGYALQCAKGTSAVRFSCVEENNQWLIQGFNFSG